MRQFVAVSMLGCNLDESNHCGRRYRSYRSPLSKEGGLHPQPADAFNFSTWKGYFEVPYYADALKWCRDGGAKIAFLHTSGHASTDDLRAFAAAMQARMVVPIHGASWDRESDGFANLRRLDDGEPLVVSSPGDWAGAGPSA